MKIHLTHILKYLFKGKNRNPVDKKETRGWEDKISVG
jgi:hypothetical protein